MLSAQQKEFIDEPGQAGSPYPKAFDRWYALDYFKRPGKLRTGRFWVTLIVTAAAAALSAASMIARPLHCAHQAGPVSTAHAMFGRQCSNCHTTTFAPIHRLFGVWETRSITDEACNACHQGAPHHARAAHEPACASCHVEHRGKETLARHVASRHCVACHGDLAAHTVGGKPAHHAGITGFHVDHPEFKASKPGLRDPARIHFNHQAHLALQLDELATSRDAVKGLGARMDCAQCHQLDAERRYFLPIQYDQHCARCHQLTAPLIGAFVKEMHGSVAEFVKTPLPHKKPAVVRAVLRDRLIAFAQTNKVVPGDAKSSATPRPLPWKPTVEVGAKTWSWTIARAREAEARLFMNRQWSKAEPLTACSHCHVEVKLNERHDGLPVYEKSAIPARWHPDSTFSHGAHRMMSCTECHDQNAAGVKVAHSKTAGDILLPTIQTCQKCHAPAGGARDACVECHRYHDQRLLRPGDGAWKLEDALRRSKGAGAWQP